MRNPAAGFGQAMVLGDVGSREDVDASGWSFQHSVGNEAGEVDAGNGVFLQVHSAENAPLSNQLDEPIRMPALSVPYCRLLIHVPTLCNTRPHRSS